MKKRLKKDLILKVLGLICTLVCIMFMAECATNTCLSHLVLACAGTLTGFIGVDIYNTIALLSLEDGDL